ncbi:MAG: FtsX-like permease family protein [Gemmatimonadaceae bacterium]
MPQRTREIGIRIALGATAGRVRGAVISEAMVVVGTDSLVGLVTTIESTRLLRTQLFGVSPIDPLSLATACALLISVGLAAAYFRLATRRASIRRARFARTDRSRPAAVGGTRIESLPNNILPDSKHSASRLSALAWLLAWLLDWPFGHQGRTAVEAGNGAATMGGRR